MRPGLQLLALAGALGLAGCGGAAPDATLSEAANQIVAEATAPPAPATPAPAYGWQLAASGEGTSLRLTGAGGAPALHLFCPAGAGRLLVNVPAFRAIGSEERLSLGGGGQVVTLVADAGGDPQRGGVTGEGPVPAELAAILSAGVSANYGAQNAGPHAAPPRAEAVAFLEACGQARAAPSPSPSPTGAACRTQDGAPLDSPALRLIGTEPFWGGRVEGRCVTYSTPEDQQGSRVWTRYAARPDGGLWSGEFGGRPFVLRTEPAPRGGCSDGMSDRRYRWSATLQVGGETRQGCADPMETRR